MKSTPESSLLNATVSTVNGRTSQATSKKRPQVRRLRNNSSGAKSKSNATNTNIARQASSYNTTEGAVLFNRQLNLLVKHQVKQQANNRTDIRSSSSSRRSVAQQATDLLLEKIHFNSTDYDAVSFNIVLSAWSRQRSITAAQKADQLLSILLTLSAQTQRHNLQANSYSYGSVLHAYAKANDGIRGATRASELLHQLESSPHIQLDTDYCHNAVMDAWAVSNHVDAGMRAEAILRRLLEHNGSVKPTKVSFNACINAYARSGQVQHVQRLLQEMKKLADAGQVHFAPDKISYTTCIDAFAKSEGSLANAKQADALLTEMERLYVATNSTSLCPDVVAYTSVLTAYAKSGRVKSQIANDLLRRMELYANDRPNSVFLNAWINLLAKNMDVEVEQDSAAAAEGLLQYMQTAFWERKQLQLKPCKITYTALITVLAEVGTVAAAERAEDLYRELEGLWRETGDLDYLPTTKTFASLLNAWARCGGASKALRRADDIMANMKRLYEETGSNDVRPNTILFVQIFQILAKSGEANAAEKAKELLREMHALYLAGCPDVRPDSTTYAYLINTFTKARVDNVAELATLVLEEAEAGYNAGIGELRPTAMLYSACLQAYAKCASKEGAQLAEGLLKQTKELYERGKIYAKPRFTFYNAVMDAHARSNGGRQAAERAVELLDEMDVRSKAGDQTLRPNTRSFNAAIFAWKNSGEADAPAHAELLLRRMNEGYKAGERSMRPDRVTINSIIGVWAKSHADNAAERAEEWLTFMETQFANGDRSLKPDSWSVNTCINAYSRSERVDAPERARMLYERMKTAYEAGDLEMRPDLITLNSLQTVLSRCSNKDERHQLTRIADEIAKLYTSTLAA
ncbi:hypothetical protein MPSEU_000619400 [Mayamaea pseudoterrestris]|nr:hypothetical protein MPSEU_000619400 [Mayamaea pseudoterrestris]